MSAGKKKNIAFFHPDLGIGGAERLIIDAAVGLQNRGHKIVIFTSHCDPRHCFDEARDGTLDVRVRGNSLVPSSILGRFSIICAILRQLHLILQTYFATEVDNFWPDAFVVDQLSAGVPWLRYLYPGPRILFYCHFPDLLLARGRQSLCKRAYRMPFDFIEQWSMSFADSVVVNSGFTKGVVKKVFPELSRTKDIQIVYPCVDVKEKEKKLAEEKGEFLPAWQDTNVILSINRFERKKDIGLAIKAFAGLGRHGREGVRLVIAGGYDNRVAENVLYHKELVILAESLGLKIATTKTIVTALNVADNVNVLFLLSVPNALKEMLLKSARLLVYTPSNEHFGIVPLEAMLACVPVLAANSGGPLETVVEGETGWLRDPEDVKSWTVVMDRVLNKMTDEERKVIGQNGTERVRREFSDGKMAERLNAIIDDMAGTRRKSVGTLSSFLFTIFVVAFDTASYLGSYIRFLRENMATLMPPFTLTALAGVAWIGYFFVGRSEEKIPERARGWARR